MNAISTKLVAAQKAEAKARKANYEAGGLSSKEQTKADNFRSTAGTLTANVRQLTDLIAFDERGRPSGVNVDTTFLGMIEKFRDGYGITDDQQDELNSAAMAFVDSLGLAGQGEGMFYMPGLSSGLDEVAKSKTAMANRLFKLIETLRDNSFELTDAQYARMTGATQADPLGANQ